MPTPENATRDLLISYLEQDTRCCPTCGYLLAPIDRCSECGQPLALTIQAGRTLPLPWLFAFVPWLALLVSGIQQWIMGIEMLSNRNLFPALGDMARAMSSARFMVLLYVNLVTLAAPIVTTILWTKRRRVHLWSPRTVFFVGLSPILAIGISLLQTFLSL